DVFERAYPRSYLPFVELLERHPGIHLGLHYSGPLLEWIEEHHPEFFVQLRGLAAKGQIELIGGGFYEPILISIPQADQQEQITRMADYMARHFGRRPAGAWLAERVWEPQLPASGRARTITVTATTGSKTSSPRSKRSHPGCAFRRPVNTLPRTRPSAAPIFLPPRTAR